MRRLYLLCSVFIVWSIGGAALTGTGIAGAQAQAVPLQVKLGDLLDLVQRYGPSLWNSFKEWSTRASSSSSASSGPSCTTDCSTDAPADDPDLFGTYSCADLPPSAPTGAYEFPLRPKYCSPHLKSVLLYCKQGKTAVFNPSDEVPQYELRPPYKKLKDTHLPPYIQDLFFEFQGDCLDTRSPVGCANHSPPLGVTTIGGTNFYMLRYYRCQSCATSLVVRIPNYLHATEVEINAFVLSSLKFPAILKVHGDRYDQHESVGVSACQETNRFANKEGCVCCGTNACFADTLRQPHNPSEEVKIPSRGLGYDLPVVRRNQPHCSPLAVDVSTNGLPSAVITVLMSGKSGGLGGWPNSDQGFPAVGTGGEIYEMWISKVLSPPKKH